MSVSRFENFRCPFFVYDHFEILRFVHFDAYVHLMSMSIFAQLFFGLQRLLKLWVAPWLKSHQPTVFLVCIFFDSWVCPKNDNRSATEIWIGGRQQPPEKYQQIQEQLKGYPVSLHNHGFETGGYSILKVRDFKLAWDLYKWLGDCGLYLGKAGGPVLEPWRYICLI